MGIVTKNGDQGSTFLLNGEKVSKSHPRIIAYGQLDQLNSQIGLLLAHAATFNKLPQSSSSIQNIAQAMLNQLEQVQSDLFCIGSQLAVSFDSKISLPSPPKEAACRFEELIEKAEQALPQLTHFILPRGDILISQAHVARATCRLTESAVVRMLEMTSEVNHPEAAPLLIYLNRLSDFLFMLARVIHDIEEIPEVVWKSKS